MVVKIDYGDGSDFLPLEPGDYDGFIFEIEERESAKGNAYLRFTFKLAKPNQNRRLWFNLTLIRETAWRVRQVMHRLLGGDVKDFVGTSEIDEKSLMGREVMLTVGPPNEEFGDGTINEVLDVWGPEGPPAGAKRPKKAEGVKKPPAKKKVANRGRKKTPAKKGY